MLKGYSKDTHCNTHIQKMILIMNILHQIILWGGRGNLLIGMSMWVQRINGSEQETFLTTWWAWSAIILWAPIEILAKRMVKPDLQYMADGGQASNKLVIGTGVQLLLIAIIFGMMHAK